MITLSLWGTEEGKVNIMKDTYFCHFDSDNHGTCIRIVKDGKSGDFFVKESFSEVTNLLKGVRL